MTMDSLNDQKWGEMRENLVLLLIIQKMFPPLQNKSRECSGRKGGGVGCTALISGSFEVLIGKQPQKAELISNLEL